MGVGCPLDLRGLVSPGNTATYASLPAVSPSFRLVDGVGASEVPCVSGAGRLAAGVMRPSEQENSTFLFPVMGSGGVTILAPVVVASRKTFWTCSTQRP